MSLINYIFSDLYSKIINRLLENSKEENEAEIVEIVKHSKNDFSSFSNRKKAKKDNIINSNLENNNFVLNDNKSKPLILVFYGKNLNVLSDSKVESMRTYLKNKNFTNSNINVNIQAENIFNNKSKETILWDKLSFFK